MMSIRSLVNLLALTMILSGPCRAQVSHLDGEWQGEFKDSLGGGNATLILTGDGPLNFAGTYATNFGGIGTVAIRPQGDGYKLILTQTTKDCPGSFVGEFRREVGSAMAGTYSGSDCHGWHENGVFSMLPKNETAQRTNEQVDRTASHSLPETKTSSSQELGGTVSAKGKPRLIVRVVDTRTSQRESSFTVPGGPSYSYTNCDSQATAVDQGTGIARANGNTDCTTTTTPGTPPTTYKSSIPQVHVYAIMPGGARVTLWCQRGWRDCRTLIPGSYIAEAKGDTLWMYAKDLSGHERRIKYQSVGGW